MPSATDAFVPSRTSTLPAAACGRWKEQVATAPDSAPIYSSTTRLKFDEPTKTYATRRTQEGKSAREIKRCLKRAVAREIYRMLEANAAAQSKALSMTA